jgi:hypothetical protein
VYFGHEQEKVESLTSGQCSMEYHEWVVMLMHVPMRSHSEMDTPTAFFYFSILIGIALAFLKVFLHTPEKQKLPSPL